MLGPLQVIADGRTIDITSGAQRRILCALLAEAGHTISAPSLCDVVWDGEPPPSAGTTLRSLVSRLRRIVGDRLVGRHGGYALVLRGDDATDAGAFVAALADALAAPGPATIAALEAALGSWRGEAFGECASLTAIRPSAERLERSRSEALEVLAGDALGAGQWQRAARFARDAVTADALREPAWTALVLALARGGRGPEAVRAAAEATKALAEIGLSPGRALRDAEAEALGIDTPAPARTSGQDATPRPAVDGRAAHRLPTLLTPMIGRDADLAAVLDALADRRIVTLVGPGGVGKTRLAIEVARTGGETHSRGAIFVPLSRVADGSDVAAAIADAIGVRPSPNGTVSFEGAGALDALVVLDNCEHVIDAVAEVVPTLFDGGDRLRVLATSREPLAIEAEHIVTVAPLPVDGPNAAAAELFRARAAAAGAPAADARDDALVVEVVQRVDGLPLALEMAAARLRTMSLGELAGAIVGDLDVLSSPRRDVDQRHRTVRDLLAWSERLLDDELRSALLAFSVFVGAVRARDLGAVVGSARPADTVARLVDRSLILTIGGDGGGVRFVALETVRSFGRERLAADPAAERAVRERHARWFCDAVAEVDSALRGHDPAGAFTRFGEIFDELRAALRWARDHDLALAVDIVRHASLVGRMSLRLETAMWAEEVAARVPPRHPAAPTALAAAAVGLSTRGRLAEARAMATAALERDPHGPGALLAVEALADAFLYEGRLADSAEAAGLGEALGAERGDPLYRDFAIVGRALASAYDGDAAAAMALLDEAQPALTAFGELWFDYVRGEASMDTDVTGALAALDRAVDGAARTGARYLVEVAMLSATTLRARAGEIGEAADRFQALLDEFALGGDLGHLVTTLRNLVTLLDRMGEPAAAAELYGAVVDHPSSPSYGAERERLEAGATSACDALGESAFRRAVATGRTRSVEAALDAARTALAGRRRAAPAVPAVVQRPPERGELRRDGEDWHVVFDGAAARVRHSKGIADLAVLLARPGAEIHALELMGGADVGHAPGAGVDATARREYQQRIVELQRTIDQAQADCDPARAALAEIELDALVDQLSAAFGLGGRARSTTSSSERARSAVTFRIRSAIRKITTTHPALGQHLDVAVRTGAWCSYRPDRPVEWTVTGVHHP